MYNRNIGARLSLVADFAKAATNAAENLDKITASVAALKKEIGGGINLTGLQDIAKGMSGVSRSASAVKAATAGIPPAMKAAAVSMAEAAAQGNTAAASFDRVSWALVRLSQTKVGPIGRDFLGIASDANRATTAVRGLAAEIESLNRIRSSRPSSSNALTGGTSRPGSSGSILALPSGRRNAGETFLDSAVITNPIRDRLSNLIQQGVSQSMDRLAMELPLLIRQRMLPPGSYSTGRGPMPAGGSINGRVYGGGNVYPNDSTGRGPISQGPMRALPGGREGDAAYTTGGLGNVRNAPVPVDVVSMGGKIVPGSYFARGTGGNAIPPQSSFYGTGGGDRTPGPGVNISGKNMMRFGNDMQSAGFAGAVNSAMVLGVMAPVLKNMTDIDDLLHQTYEALGHAGATPANARKFAEGVMKMSETVGGDFRQNIIGMYPFVSSLPTQTSGLNFNDPAQQKKLLETYKTAMQVNVADTSSSTPQGMYDMSLYLAATAHNLGLPLKSLDDIEKSYRTAANYLLAIKNKTGSTAAQAALAFRNVGPGATAAGVDPLELAGIITVLADSKILGSQAGNQTRRILQRQATDPAALAKMQKAIYNANIKDDQGNRINLSMYDQQGRMKGMYALIGDIVNLQRDHMRPDDVQGRMKMDTILSGLYAAPGMGALIQWATQNVPKGQSVPDALRKFGKDTLTKLPPGSKPGEDITSATVRIRQQNNVRSQVQMTDSRFLHEANTTFRELKPDLTEILHGINDLIKSFGGLPGPVKKGMVEFVAGFAIISGFIGIIGILAGNFVKLGGGLVAIVEWGLRLFGVLGSGETILSVITAGFSGLAAAAGVSAGVLGSVFLGVGIIYAAVTALQIRENQAFLENWGQLVAGVSSGAKQIGQFFSNLLHFETDWASKSVVSFLSWISGFKQISPAVQSISTNVRNYLGQMVSDAIKSGESFVSQFVGGIVNGAQAAVGRVKGALQWIANLFPHSPPADSSSPLAAVYANSGGALSDKVVADISLGFEKGRPKIKSSLHLLGMEFSNLKTDADRSGTDLADTFVTSTITEIHVGLPKVKKAAFDFSDTFVNSTVGRLNEGRPRIFSAVESIAGIFSSFRQSAEKSGGDLADSFTNSFLSRLDRNQSKIPKNLQLSLQPGQPVNFGTGTIKSGFSFGTLPPPSSPSLPPVTAASILAAAATPAFSGGGGPGYSGGGGGPSASPAAHPGIVASNKMIDDLVLGLDSGKKKVKKAVRALGDSFFDIKDSVPGAVEAMVIKIEDTLTKHNAILKKKWIDLFSPLTGATTRINADPAVVREVLRLGHVKDTSVADAHQYEVGALDSMKANPQAMLADDAKQWADQIRQFITTAKTPQAAAEIEHFAQIVLQAGQRIMAGQARVSTDARERMFGKPEVGQDFGTTGPVGKVATDFGSESTYAGRFQQTKSNYEEELQNLIRLQKGETASLSELGTQMEKENAEKRALSPLLTDEINKRIQIKTEITALTEAQAGYNDVNDADHKTRDQLKTQIQTYNDQMATLNTTINTQQTDMTLLNTRIDDYQKKIATAQTATDQFTKVLSTAFDKALKSSIDLIGKDSGNAVDAWMQKILGVKGHGKNLGSPMQQAIADFVGTFVKSVTDQLFTALFSGVGSTLTTAFQGLFGKPASGGGAGTGILGTISGALGVSLPGTKNGRAAMTGDVSGGQTNHGTISTNGAQDVVLRAQTGTTDIGSLINVNTQQTASNTADTGIGSGGGNVFGGTKGNSPDGSVNGKAGASSSTLSNLQKGIKAAAAAYGVFDALSAVGQNGGSLTAGLEAGASTLGMFSGGAAAMGGAGPYAAAAMFLYATFGGPHWGPASNTPDRGSNQQNYGQQLADWQGGSPYVNGTQYIAQQQYNPNEGGQALNQQIQAAVNNPAFMAGLTPDQQTAAQYFLSLEGGNPNANLGIASEHNGMFTLGNGMQANVQQFDTQMVAMEGILQTFNQNALQQQQNANALANSFTTMILNGPAGFIMPDAVGGGTSASGIAGIVEGGKKIPSPPGIRNPLSMSGSSTAAIQAQTVNLSVLQGATIANADGVLAAIQEAIPMIVSATNQTNYNQMRLQGNYSSDTFYS